MDEKPINAFKKGTTILINTFKNIKEANKVLFNSNWQTLNQIRHNVTGHRKSSIEHPIYGEIYFRYAIKN